MKDIYNYIGPIHEVLPMTGLPERGALADSDLKRLTDQGILIKNGKIDRIDKHEKLLPEAEKLGAEMYVINGKYCALPGFLDSHTHICFAGSRAHDYAMRNAGKSYLDIAKAGGGIWDTVTHTRKATEADLVAGIVKRADLLISRGITTIEVKSGYGLSPTEELKMLRAIQQAQEKTAATLIPTCLAAHTVPKEFKGNTTGYIKEIIEELMPQIQEEHLAKRVDAFIEQSSFTPENIRPYFKKAKELGFDITVHADQFTTGGSRAAVDFGAVSADHLEASTAEEIKLLAQSDTVATVLPGATLGLGCAFAPARRLLDQGAILAIASDWNPGSAPMGDLLAQAAILGTFEKLSNAEILAGITIRAAKALNLGHSVALEKGNPADLVLFKTDSYANILYHQGQLKPDQVFKNGKQVFKTVTS
ncbi:imidazolonepropionase [Pricia antarctica]|uniref:Imidazolonepropionase n=1 Tax=Pricia antarctica TaxID=641691 RepID=A0A1G6YF09_9FLAO|nr:imidazolonepropionase [Pricia antarctica]SDD88307.1 imidazolonepropionase [Pricia antarctica]